MKPPLPPGGERTARRKSARLAIVLWLAGAALAQQLPVPSHIQYELLTKIMTFDRNFKRRVTNEIVIGVLFQKSNPVSLGVEEEWVSILAQNSAPDFEGIRARAVPLDWKDEKSLDSALAAESVNILYVAPLKDVSISEVSALCRARRITSVSGIASYVKQGITLGFERKGAGVQILINLKSARAEGANFSSRLLSLARIVDE